MKALPTPLQQLTLYLTPRSPEQPTRSLTDWRCTGVLSGVVEGRCFIFLLYKLGVQHSGLTLARPSAPRGALRVHMLTPTQGPLPAAPLPCRPAAVTSAPLSWNGKWSERRGAEGVPTLLPAKCGPLPFPAGLGAVLRVSLPLTHHLSPSRGAGTTCLRVCLHTSL